MERKTERQDSEAPERAGGQRLDLFERMCAAATSTQSVREAIVRAIAENRDNEDEDEDSLNLALDSHLRQALDETSTAQHNLVRLADWLSVRNFPSAHFRVTVSIQRWIDDADKN
jgi:hypothetical protein